MNLTQLGMQSCTDLWGAGTTLSVSVLQRKCFNGHQKWGIWAGIHRKEIVLKNTKTTERMTRFIKCSLRYRVTVMGEWRKVDVNAHRAPECFHIALLSAQQYCKGPAKWSVWRASLLKPHVLEIKFIKPVGCPACSLGWLSGLKFVQLAVDFKCKSYISFDFLHFSSLSSGKYSKLMAVSLWYFDPFLLQKAKSF